MIVIILVVLVYWTNGFGLRKTRALFAWLFHILGFLKENVMTFLVDLLGAS